MSTRFRSCPASRRSISPAARVQSAKLQGYDVLLLDTAGRLHVDDSLMGEMKAVAEVSRPAETLLVVDSLTGQDAVNVAKGFGDQIALTGVILTRMDGDARGGAALSMRAVTGKPIKFAGTGEGLDAIEPFHPSRVAGRILGMGDVVSLVERAAETIKVEDAEKLAAKMAKGKFDLDDLRMQLDQMKRMGGLGALAGMMPGMKGMKGAMEKAQDSKALVHLEAMLSSMTATERAKPGADQCQAQDPHRQGQRPHRSGSQQAPEDAPGNGRRDEAPQEDGRPRQAGRHVRQGRHGGRDGRPPARCRRAWPARPSRRFEPVRTAARRQQIR